MPHKLSRRDLIKGAAVVGAASLVPDGAAQTARANILPLTSTSEVFVPPRGESFMQFSFDFPEPSVAFEGLRFAFRIYTFENTYAPDPARMTAVGRPDGVEIRCDSFVWAGGQERAPGRLTAHIRRNGAFVEWDVSVEMDRPIKSVAAILRDVPRGKVAVGGGRFADPKDDELLFGYPFGGGSLFTAAGMYSPVAVVQAADETYFSIAADLDRVTANRFHFHPGESGYRVELTFEKEGWLPENRVQSPTWRAWRSKSLEGALRPHFERVERVFRVPSWEERADVPDWLRKVSLVAAIHGAHWTGYVFNDYAKTLKTLEWISREIPAEQVLVFLPAWDGRYYWNYPLYKPDPRMGGEVGFARLIDEGRRLGFRMMPMFGTNSVNRRHPEFARFADAAMEQIDGDAFNLNWVDWDNDRHFEGWSPFMNVGVESWRRWLTDRISEVVERYHVDAYFLDIVGGWQNNTKADPHEGTRRLVGDLRERHPSLVAVGEFAYDALLSFIPVHQVFPTAGFPSAFTRHARAFQHLSHPAPGRGSSGVHEVGFTRFDPTTLSLNDLQIPTITFVDDTMERHRAEVSAIIEKARSPR